MERVEARVSRGWAVRMTIAGIAFLGFGIMSLYDGKVRYPEVNRDFKSYLVSYIGQDAATLRMVYDPDEDLSRFAGFCERWNEYWKGKRGGWLARRGWKDVDQSKLLTRAKRVPGQPDEVRLLDHIYSDWDLRTQLLMAAVCLPVGLIMLVRLIRALPRTLAADHATLHALDGRQIPFSAIIGIDKKKWDRKAIAVVHYRIDGRNGKAIIDDWIYKGAAEVLERVENALRGAEGEQPQT